MSACESILLANLAARNFEARYFATSDAVRTAVLDQIPAGSSVGFGNSQTLKTLRLAELLAAKGCLVHDKTVAGSAEEAREIMAEAARADFYILSGNAISRDGRIVNIDHTGNRVAALLYGPKHVMVIAGINKIADSLEDAIHRARNEAAIKNARRAGMHPPCVERGTCVDCRSAERVCNALVILEGQVDRERIKVFIVGEELGF